MPNASGTLRRFRFDQLATQVNDRVDDPAASGVERYVGLEHLDADSLSIRRWGEITDVESTKLRFQPGDIIFGKRRVYQRKLAVADFEGICSAHAMVLRAKPDVVDPGFLPYFMQSDRFMERALSISVGSLSPTINWKDLAQQEFALPPIEEQRRIVCALSAFDEAVESVRCASAAQRASHAALLEQLFPLRRTQELCRSQRTECEGWLRLRELAVFQSGYPFESTGFVATGDRLLRGSNVGVGAINWPPDDTRYWPIERRGDVAHYVLREGDIVIAMDRPFINDGFKAARVSCVDLPALLLQRVGRFVAESAGSAAVLWAFVQSRAFQWQLSSGIEGTNVPHISKSQIESTWLPREVFEAGAVLGALDASEKCAKGLRVRAEQLLEHRCRVLGAAL